jgi:hypothetical protein
MELILIFMHLNPDHLVDVDSLQELLLDQSGNVFSQYFLCQWEVLIVTFAEYLLALALFKLFVCPGRHFRDLCSLLGAFAYFEAILRVNWFGSCATLLLNWRWIASFMAEIYV